MISTIKYLQLSKNYVETFGAVLVTVYLIMIVAEFGDKTNIVALSLIGQSGRPYWVALFGTVGIGLSTILSVLIGGLLGATLPVELIRYTAAVIFIWLGISSLRENTEEMSDSDQIDSELNWYRVVYLVALAELGDKSQLFALTAAAASFPLAVFMGSLLGMGTIMLLTAIVGSVIFEKINPDRLEVVTAALFILAGLWLGISTLLGL